MILEIDNNITEKDSESCCQLLFRQMEFIGSPRTMEQIRSSFKNACSNNVITKIFAYKDIDDTIKGIAIGNIGCSVERGSNYLWLNELYVSEAERKRGIASAIIQYIIEWCGSKNVKGISLITDPDNNKATNLYLKLGFKGSEVVYFQNKII